jgi:hypothetical protein
MVGCYMALNYATKRRTKNNQNVIKISVITPKLIISNNKLAVSSCKATTTTTVLD